MECGQIVDGNEVADKVEVFEEDGFDVAVSGPKFGEYLVEDEGGICQGALHDLLDDAEGAFVACVEEAGNYLLEIGIQSNLGSMHGQFHTGMCDAPRWGRVCERTESV